ncbi:hypothetical protein [Desulfosporosinus sp. BG]|nr:hypothetical protein [Desulfosporosinus sp. BG]ODA41610.1 hypothetical protein DSBG_1539 [Desulfosporosinus sp. BG]
MIQVYTNYVACDTYEEAIVAQGIIVNEIVFHPQDLQRSWHVFS